MDGSLSGMERRQGINPPLVRGIRPMVPRADSIIGKGSWEITIIDMWLEGEVGHSLHPHNQT